jgi:hypothetical protein
LIGEDCLYYDGLNRSGPEKLILGGIHGSSGKAKTNKAPAQLFSSRPRTCNGPGDTDGENRQYVDRSEDQCRGGEMKFTLTEPDHAFIVLEGEMSVFDETT